MASRPDLSRDEIRHVQATVAEATCSSALPDSHMNVNNHLS